MSLVIYIVSTCLCIACVNTRVYTYNEIYVPIFSKEPEETSLEVLFEDNGGHGEVIITLESLFLTKINKQASNCQSICLPSFKDQVF